MIYTTPVTDPQFTTYLVQSVNPAPNGKSTLSFPDGTVLSLQENGSWDVRQAGSAGPFEQCDVSGSMATYWYEWPVGSGILVGPKTIAFVRTSGPAK